MHCFVIAFVASYVVRLHVDVRTINIAVVIIFCMLCCIVLLKFFLIFYISYLQTTNEQTCILQFFDVVFANVF